MFHQIKITIWTTYHWFSQRPNIVVEIAINISSSVSEKLMINTPVLTCKSNVLHVWIVTFPVLKPDITWKLGQYHAYRCPGSLHHEVISNYYLVVIPENIWMQLILNSSGPSDAIWRHRSGSTLAQVMACCLMAPSHYLNQCWLIINKVQLHSSEGNFTRDILVISD